MLTLMVLVLFLLERNMIDVNSLDKIFVDDVMYLFDQGKNLSQIAYIMGCDTDMVDAIVCQSITDDVIDTL
jgi:hypothetical protein